LCSRTRSVSRSFSSSGRIRALPAAVSLFGRWNWWLPRWPARVLRVEPSRPRLAEAGDEA